MPSIRLSQCAHAGSDALRRLLFIINPAKHLIFAFAAYIVTSPAHSLTQKDNEAARATVSPIGAIDLTNAGKPSNLRNIIDIQPGIVVSFCPILACIYTPRDSRVSASSFFDHQRTSVLLQTTTMDDGHSEEQNLSVITTIGSGYVRPYVAKTVYQTGDNAVVGNAIYRAVAGGKTGDNSRPSGARPTANQGGDYTVTDGTVRWKWINDAAIDAKVGAYVETNVVPGAGAAWGAAFNYHFRAKPKTGNFFAGVEMDYVNDSGFACDLGVADCTAFRLALGGNPVTEGLQVTGNNSGAYSSFWGLRLNGDKLASQSAIEVDAAVPVALSFGGSGIGGQSHAIATIQDVTTSPASLSISGVHSLAAILDKSNSQTGLALLGSYKGAQIEGRNFVVYPNGSQRIGATLTLSPKEGFQATVSYDDTTDRTIIQSIHSKIATTLALNPSGGLIQAGSGGFAEILTTPASSSAPCVPGQFADDANYHYVCVQTNKWKRVALSPF